MTRNFFLGFLIFFFFQGCSIFESLTLLDYDSLVSYKYQELLFNGVFPGTMNIEVEGDTDSKIFSDDSFVVFQSSIKNPDFIEMNDEIVFKFCISTINEPNSFIDSSSQYGTETVLFSTDNFQQEIINGLLGKEEGSRVVILNKAQEIFKFFPTFDFDSGYLTKDDILIYQFDIISINKSKK